MTDRLYGLDVLPHRGVEQAQLYGFPPLIRQLDLQLGRLFPVWTA